MTHSLKKCIAISLLLSPLAIAPIFANDLNKGKQCRKDDHGKKGKDCKKDGHGKKKHDRNGNHGKRDPKCETPEKGQKSLVGLWNIKALLKNDRNPAINEALAKLLGHVAFNEGGTAAAVVTAHELLQLENLIDDDIITALGLWEKRKKDNCFKVLLTTLVELPDISDNTQFNEPKAKLKIVLNLKVSKDGCSVTGKGIAFLMPLFKPTSENENIKFEIVLSGDRVQIKDMKKKKRNHNHS